MKNANNQQLIGFNSIKNAVLPKSPTSETEAAVFIDLPSVRIGAQEIEAVHQAEIVGITRRFAMDDQDGNYIVSMLQQVMAEVQALRAESSK